MTRYPLKLQGNHGSSSGYFWTVIIFPQVRSIKNTVNSPRWPIFLFWIFSIRCKNFIRMLKLLGLISLLQTSLHVIHLLLEKIPVYEYSVPCSVRALICVPTFISRSYTYQALKQLNYMKRNKQSTWRHTRHLKHKQDMDWVLRGYYLHCYHRFWNYKSLVLRCFSTLPLIP